MENNTLGYHRDMCAEVFGEESKATEYMNEKISKALNGRNEEIIVSEYQLVELLEHIHLNYGKSQ